MNPQQLKKPKNSSEKPQGSQSEQHFNQQPFRWNKFEERYHQKKKAEQQQHEIKGRGTVQLPIGTVMKVGFKEDIPEGWRRMRIQEGRQYKEELRPLVQTWSIIGFEIGALQGHGYGFDFKDNYGDQCGEGFIIKPKQTTTH